MGSEIVRRGQSTFEYAMLIGITAAGIILMLVYISRGHQGQVRSQADQLGARQYAPGQTTIVSDAGKPTEAKQLSSLASSGSQTKTEHPADADTDEPNPELDGQLDEFGNPTPAIDGLMEQIGDPKGGKQAAVYQKMDEYENILEKGGAGEGVDEAAWARTNGLPWYEERYNNLASTLKLVDLDTTMGELNALWQKVEDNRKAREAKPRKPDKTTTTSYSEEEGKIKTEKNTNETLGAW